MAQDVTKVRVWMKKFQTYACACAHKHDTRLELLLKVLLAIREDVSTKEVFTGWKVTDVVMTRKLDTISEEMQFMSMALLEGDALYLVMRTPSANADGKGFDSLRRIQASYDAGVECLAPILLQQFSNWSAEVNLNFRRSFEI